MVLIWTFSQSMNGAGLGCGCCALAVPAHSAAAAASATRAIRFMCYTPLFFSCERPAFPDRRETAPPFGAGRQHATYRAAGECALAGLHRREREAAGSHFLKETGVTFSRKMR